MQIKINGRTLVPFKMMEFEPEPDNVVSAEPLPLGGAGEPPASDDSDS